MEKPQGADREKYVPWVCSACKVDRMHDDCESFNEEMASCCECPFCIRRFERNMLKALRQGS